MPVRSRHNAPNAFGRLMLIVRSNEGLLTELGTLGGRSNGRGADLAGRGAPGWAVACLGPAGAKRSGVLAMLRANRIEAGQILEAAATRPKPRRPGAGRRGADTGTGADRRTQRDQKP